MPAQCFLTRSQSTWDQCELVLNHLGAHAVSSTYWAGGLATKSMPFSMLPLRPV